MLEPPARLERATRALGEPCSIRLSYGGLRTIGLHVQSNSMNSASQARQERGG